MEETKYALLSPDTASRNSDTFSPLHESRGPWRRRTAVVVILQSLACLVCVVAAFFLGRYSVTDKECGQRLSTWSPALDSIEYQKVMFDGAFLASSPFRGEPSPEVEAAWDALGPLNFGAIRIRPEDLAKLNKTYADNLLFIDDDSGDAAGLLEVAHQLHCLNTVRQATWPGHYPHSANEKAYRAHIDHCIEILRIKLMCDADITPITYHWVDYKRDPDPDFSTLHTCRNFDKIVAWNAEFSGFPTKDGGLHSGHV